MSLATAPTPPHEDPPTGLYASYVPHDLPYDERFEDSIMRAVLHQSAHPDGIRVLAEDSSEQAEDGVSVRLGDISLHSLPNIAEEQLPLPLNDSRRIFASAVSGLRLTHPGGYLEGGPGLDPEMDTFPEDFISSRGINDAQELRVRVDEEIAEQLELLKSRMHARQEALEQNERVKKELQALLDQRSMEVKIENRVKAEAQARREKKEERRRMKEGA